MSTESLQTWAYVEGRPPRQQQGYATYYTKPTSPGYTGGGYKLWRSNERRPHTPTEGKEDVYVAAHRLLAVVECYPSDMDIGDVMDDLHGKDVHHTTGMPSANFGESPNFDRPGIEVIGHGEHSSVTQAQMRAWGEDAKTEVEKGDEIQMQTHCSHCGGEAEALAESEDWEDRVCLDCSKELSDGSPIEVI